MKTYYFQIRCALEWEQTPAEAYNFDRRIDAVKFARLMADTHEKEVRMTDNERLFQGSYFRPSFTSNLTYK